MNNDEKKVNDALSDIFDTDFLEIDIKSDQMDNQKEDIMYEDNNIIENQAISNHNESYEIPMEQIDMLKENKLFVDDAIIKDNESIEEKKEKIIETNNDILVKSNIVEDPFPIDGIKENIKDELNKKDTNYKKVLICFLIGVVIGAVIIFFIVKYVTNIERKSYCSYEAKDTNFNLTDEYTITYKGNSITYVEGTYIYTALTDEFKSQIEFIKQEKLPVIVNSNGMSGFTHIYEQSDNYIKVSSYYDVKLFDFDVVDKNDDKVTPISYINLKSDVTYKKLKQSLEENGYKCTLSK